MLIANAIAEEIQGLKTIAFVSEHRIQRRTSSGFVPQMNQYSLKILKVFKEYGFMWSTKPKEVLRWILAPMQSFVILGSLLQWRWQ